MKDSAPMKDSGAISILEELHRLESTSFIRYLVEMSRPPIVSDTDRKALALYQDLYRDSERNVQALGQLLADADIVPVEPRWPLVYTTYNFLRPLYLLGPLHERMRLQLEQVESKSKALDARDWSEAKEVMGTVLRRERAALERLDKAVAETPKEDPEPARVKGTSASRW